MDLNQLRMPRQKPLTQRTRAREQTKRNIKKLINGLAVEQPSKMKIRLRVVTEKLDRPYKVVPKRVRTIDKMCPGLTTLGLLKNIFSRTKVTMGRMLRMMLTLTALAAKFENATTNRGFRRPLF